MYVVRSGRPKVLRLTAKDSATASDQESTFLPGVVTTWMQLHNRGPSTIRVYFTLADMTNGVNYLEVAAGDRQDMPVEIGGPNNNLIGLFMQGDGGDSDFTLFYGERLA